MITRCMRHNAPGPCLGCLVEADEARSERETAELARYVELDRFANWAESAAREVVRLAMARCPQKRSMHADEWEARRTALVADLRLLAETLEAM